MKRQTIPSPWLILAITSLAVFAVMLDALVLFVAFPAIEQSFRTVSSTQLSWVLNGYTIVYGALLVPAGRLADLVGRKKIFLGGALLFTVASMLCGLATTPGWLIAARVLQAVGGALLTPTSLALTLATFPQAQRAQAVTIWSAVGALAVVIGPPLGSLIVETIGWPGIFFLNLPIGLLAVGVGAPLLQESRDESRGHLPDGLGVLLLVMGPALLAFGIVQSEVWGWRAPAVWLVLLLGVVALLLFGVRSTRVTTPALDLTLFQDRTFLLSNVGLFLFSVAFAGFFLSSILFLTRLWHYSLIQAGAALMPGPLMVVCIAPLAGRLAGRYGHRLLLVPGGLFFAGGSLLRLLTITEHPDFLVDWLPATLLTGIGVALVMPVLSSAAVHYLPPQKLAAGSGVNQAIRQFGTVLGVSLTFVLMGAAPATLLPFQHLFLLMLIGGLCVSFVSLGIDTRSTPAPSNHAVAQAAAGQASH